MVFTRLGFGFICGVAYPMYCHEQIYILLATSFMRPHLKWRMDKDALPENGAITNEMLDAYVKDLVTSTIFFFMTAPMIFKRVYWDKEENPMRSPEQKEEKKLHEVEDRVVTLLQEINNRKSKKEALMAENDEDVQVRKPV